MEEKALGVITDSAEAGSLLAAGPSSPPMVPTRSLRVHWLKRGVIQRHFKKQHFLS